MGMPNETIKDDSIETGITQDEYYKDLYENVPEMHLSFDSAGCILGCNQTLSRVTGYSKDEIIGQTIFKIYHPECLEKVKKTFQIFLDTGEIHNAELMILHKDGSKIDVSLNSTALRDATGRILYSRSTLHDITRRKRTEDALTKSEERFRIIFERSTVGKSITSPDGKLLHINEAFAGMLGYTTEEMQQLNFAAITHPDDLAKSRESIRCLLANEQETYSMEKRYLHKDGGIVWTSVSTTLLHDLHGIAQYFITSITDISDLKRMAEALREANDNLERQVAERTGELKKNKHLLEETARLARVGGWEIDLKKNELSWTEMVYMIHEVGPDYHPTLETAINFYAPEAVPVISDAVRCAIESGKSFDLELPLITAKGNRVWVRAIGEAYRENGEIVRIGGMFHDITERKLAGDELNRYLSKLELSNKELEQFAYVASHDLQEPLRMISSYTQLLGQRYADKLDDKARKYIDYAVDGAMRMQMLINDLLTYSRVSTQGKAPEQSDSHSILGQAIRNLSTAIEESHSLVTNDDLPVIYVDSTQLLQVFQNLIANAIKFHGKDSPIVHISTSDLGHEWLFSVEDNGIGIDPKHANKLFVIFQRLHTREEYPGTGIGLAVCKRIVERHGGKIWFESEPGKGSTFHFTLPKVKEILQ